MQTRDQLLANRIFAQVTAFKDAATPKAVQDYGSMAHKLPVLVRTAGLAQALAFVDARGEPACKLLLRDLAAVLGYTMADQLVAASRAAEFRAYLQLTQQVMGALIWYKRFTHSVLDVDATDEAAAGATL